MLNCSRCSRWRPASDYGARESAAATRGDWCLRCRRADEPELPEAAIIAPARWSLERARRRVAAGEAFWCGPFRDWLLEPGELGMPCRANRHGWTILAVWGGVDESALRYATDPDALTIDIDVVDRILLWEGTTRLDELYPLEEPQRGAVAA